MLAVIIALIGATATIVAAVIGTVASSSNNSNRTTPSPLSANNNDFPAPSPLPVVNSYLPTSNPISLTIKSVSFSVRNGKMKLIVSGIYSAQPSEEYIYAIARPSKVPSGTASWLASEPVPANNGPWTADITLTAAESDQRMTVFAVLAGGCLPGAVCGAPWPPGPEAIEQGGPQAADYSSQSWLTSTVPPIR